MLHPDGYAEIRDRLKDVIISGGENISSVEVEGALLRHPEPYRRWRSSACRTRSGARRRTPSWCSATAAAPPRRTIIAFARERVAHFKAPRGVTFVSELPKTATGKIQKYVLRKGAPNLTRQ